MRCPDCNKFVAFEQRDPEVDTPEVDSTGTVTCEVEIVNECADCGTDLTQASFSLEADSPFTTDEITKHRQDHPDCDGFEVEADDGERTERTEGKGRGTRMFYGASVVCTIKCRCDDTDVQTKPEDRLEAEVTLTDDIQSSHMDEC